MERRGQGASSTCGSKTTGDPRDEASNFAEGLIEKNRGARPCTFGFRDRSVRTSGHTMTAVITNDVYDATTMDRLLQALVSAATDAWDSERGEGIGGGSGSVSNDDSIQQQFERQVHAELLFHARRLCPGRRCRRPPDDEEDDDTNELELVDLVKSAVEIARSHAIKSAEGKVNDGGADKSHAKKFKATASASAALDPPPPPPSTLTSFSLLDQFNAKLLGVGGMGLVTIEQIVEAETLEDKLELLQQVQSLDEEDWLQGTTAVEGDTDGGDWGQVLAVVRQGLAAPESPSGGVATGYVTLLEKWLDMAGSAASGGSAFGGAGTIGELQLDLVQLAVDAVVVRAKALQLDNGAPSDSLRPADDRSPAADAASPSALANERGILTALLRCVWATWMDWMMHSESRIGAGNEGRVEAIGLQLWNATAPGDAQPGLLSSVLSSLDPCARWFSSWMSLRSGYPGKGVLDAMVGPCGGDGASADGASPLSRAWRDLARRDADLSPGGGGDALLVCCYWLSVMHSLLVHLRVSHFPWKLLRVQGQNDDPAAQADDMKEGVTMVSIMNLYLKVLTLMDLPVQRGRHDGNDTGTLGSQESRWKLLMQDICLDAIDTLLSGCRGRVCFSALSRSVCVAVAANPNLKALATEYLQ
jgi:hypothetical protein